MNRRDFIANTTVLGSTLLLSNGKLKTLAGPKFKMGYQLFSVNDDMNRDPIGTLKKLKKMGYEDFEIYGFDHEQTTYYGIPAAELKSVMADLGLSASSGHYGFAPFLNESDDAMKKFVDQIIKGAHALKTPYITWPWIAPEQRNKDTFKKMSYALNKIGEQVHSAGLGFAYHNHGYEFQEFDGVSGYEIILSETDAEFVKLQMDMYWVMYEGKSTPKELVKKYPGRYVMWHIKDMHKVSRDYTELGNGSIDYTSVLPDPKESGLEYYYIEQGGNFTHNAMQKCR